MINFIISDNDNWKIGITNSILEEFEHNQVLNDILVKTEKVTIDIPSDRDLSNLYRALNEKLNNNIVDKASDTLSWSCPLLDFMLVQRMLSTDHSYERIRGHSGLKNLKKKSDDSYLQTISESLITCKWLSLLFFFRFLRPECPRILS